MLFHTKLFTVLHSCGIRGNLLHGYVIFFTGRTHCTKVGTKLSDFLALISGVVQGSVIGPMMFLIFINELVWLLDKYGVKVKLFADDVKLYLRIVNDVDILVLQDELTAVYKWANEWQLSVSIENCYILLLGKATNQVVLSVGNSVLLVVQSCHDLGITMTHDLSFSEQMTWSLEHTSMPMPSYVVLSHVISPFFCVHIWFVTPLLEYNSATWSPH